MINPWPDLQRVLPPSFCLSRTLTKTSGLVETVTSPPWVLSVTASIPDLQMRPAPLSSLRVMLAALPDHLMLPPGYSAALTSPAGLL